MTTLCLVDLTRATAPVSIPRTIRDEVSQYCQQLGLSAVQANACVDVARTTHSAREGKITADRIHDKMRAIRARNFPPMAA